MYTFGYGKGFSAVVILYQKTLINSVMKTIFYVIAIGVMLNLMSCATPTGESSDKSSADTLTMEELEEIFDSSKLGNTLDSIAIEK